jgi:hypothetical protein
MIIQPSGGAKVPAEFCIHPEILSVSRSDSAYVGMRIAKIERCDPTEAAMNNPWKVSAQFAAFVWYTNHPREKSAEPGAATRFARDNWVAFLPYADEGVGKLLMKISQPTTHPVKRTSPTRNGKHTPKAVRP